MNQKVFDALPGDLKQIVKSAAAVTNQEILAEYGARNNQALQTLVNEHHVEVRKLPDEVLLRLRTLSEEVVAEIAKKDELSQRVYASFQSFREQAISWSAISEQAYLNARSM